MTQTIISNEDIREIVREQITEIIDRKLDEVYTVTPTMRTAVARSWADMILGIENLAVVDRDAELPQVAEEARKDRKWVAAFVCGEMELIKKGWRKCL